MADPVSVVQVLRARTPQDPVFVDDAYLADTLAALGLDGTEAGESTRRILSTVVEDRGDEPLAVRNGSRSVRITADSFVSSVCSALAVQAMQGAQVPQLPVIVMAALAPALFLMDEVEVEPAPPARSARSAEPDAEAFSVLLTRSPASRGRHSASWAELPDDLRHEVPYTVYARLIEQLDRAGRPQDGRPAAGAVAEESVASASSPARLRFPVAAQHPGDRPDWRPRVLMLCDEWLPSKGGISALNRKLSVGLVEAGAEVYCQVAAATEAERADADAAGVHLLVPRPLPGAAAEAVSGRRPPLPDGVQPDIVVGHTRITGPQATMVVQDYFEKAVRVHFVHMAPDEVAWLKDRPQHDAAERAERQVWIEMALARDAACVAAVGPRLHRTMQLDLSVLDRPPRLIRIDPGFDRSDPRTAAPPPGVPQVLLIGRLDDHIIKGLDIAARALGEAASLLGGAEPFEVLLRGVSGERAAQVRQDVRTWSGLPSLPVTIRSFSTDEEALRNDLRRASLMLMPSRAEGFGLVGAEAISAGTPVLISGRSGLGMLLREVLHDEPERADRFVLPVREDAGDVRRWGSAIAAVLRNRRAAFDDAAELRDTMARARPWARTCAEFLDAARSEGVDAPFRAG